MFWFTFYFLCLIHTSQYFAALSLYYKLFSEMLEISMNYTPTNVWVPSSSFLLELLYNFTLSVQVFLLWLEGSVRLTEKKALYFYRNVISQKSWGVRFQPRLPGLDIFIGAFLGEERKPSTGRHSPPINLSPTPVLSRLAALPSKQTGTMQPFVQAGDLQHRQTISTALAATPPFGPFQKCLRSREKQSLRSYLQHSLLSYIILKTKLSSHSRF